MKVYRPQITTEHGTYGAFTYETYRQAELACIDLHKELIQNGHRFIKSMKVETIKYDPADNIDC